RIRDGKRRPPPRFRVGLLVERRRHDERFPVTDVPQRHVARARRARDAQPHHRHASERVRPFEDIRIGAVVMRLGEGRGHARGSLPVFVSCAARESAQAVYSKAAGGPPRKSWSNGRFGAFPLTRSVMCCFRSVRIESSCAWVSRPAVTAASRCVLASSTIAWISPSTDFPLSCAICASVLPPSSCVRTAAAVTPR